MLPAKAWASLRYSMLAHMLAPIAKGHRFCDKCWVKMNKLSSGFLLEFESDIFLKGKYFLLTNTLQLQGKDWPTSLLQRNKDKMDCLRWYCLNLHLTTVSSWTSQEMLITRIFFLSCLKVVVVEIFKIMLLFILWELHTIHFGICFVLSTSSRYPHFCPRFCLSMFPMFSLCVSLFPPSPCP